MYFKGRRLLETFQIGKLLLRPRLQTLCLRKKTNGLTMASLRGSAGSHHYKSIAAATQNTCAECGALRGRCWREIAAQCSAQLEDLLKPRLQIPTQSSKR